MAFDRVSKETINWAIPPSEWVIPEIEDFVLVLLISLENKPRKGAMRQSAGAQCLFGTSIFCEHFSILFKEHYKFKLKQYAFHLFR